MAVVTMLYSTDRNDNNGTSFLPSLLLHIPTSLPPSLPPSLPSSLPPFRLPSLPPFTHPFLPPSFYSFLPPSFLLPIPSSLLPFTHPFLPPSLPPFLSLHKRHVHSIAMYLEVSPTQNRTEQNRTALTLSNSLIFSLTYLIFAFRNIVRS